MNSTYAYVPPSTACQILLQISLYYYRYAPCWRRSVTNETWWSYRVRLIWWSSSVDIALPEVNTPASDITNSPSRATDKISFIFLSKLRTWRHQGLKETAGKDLSGKRGKMSISARGFIREWWPDQVVKLLLSISSLVRSSQTCFIQTVYLISDQGSYNMKALPHYHITNYWHKQIHAAEINRRGYNDEDISYDTLRPRKWMCQ